MLLPPDSPSPLLQHIPQSRRRQLEIDSQSCGPAVEIQQELHKQPRAEDALGRNDSAVPQQGCLEMGKPQLAEEALATISFTVNEPAAPLGPMSLALGAVVAMDGSTHTPIHGSIGGASRHVLREGRGGGKGADRSPAGDDEDQSCFWTRSGRAGPFLPRFRDQHFPHPPDSTGGLPGRAGARAEEFVWIAWITGRASGHQGQGSRSKWPIMPTVFAITISILHFPRSDIVEIMASEQRRDVLRGAWLVVFARRAMLDVDG